jgi:hypothetical protein
MPCARSPDVRCCRTGPRSLRTSSAIVPWDRDFGRQGMQIRPQSAVGPFTLFPIRSYQACPGVIDGKMAVWANCLNSPCVIDRNNPDVATRARQTATGSSPFIIASEHADPAICRSCTVDSHGHYNCPGGVISSATTAGAEQTTVLIQDAIGDVKVFPPPSK